MILVWSVWVFLLLVWICCCLSNVDVKGDDNNSMRKYHSPHLIIPDYLAARSHLSPLGNVHGFANVCGKQFCGDFHMAAYYIEPHLLEVVISRLDQLFWDFNVSIFVQSLSHSSSRAFMREVIDLGPSRSHEGRFELKTSINLVPDSRVSQKQKIPKTIIQTYFTRAAQSVYQVNAHQTFVDLNPEYEIKMFTDKDCRMFIRRHFSSVVVEAYDVLIAPTFKADLFRYAYLALQGGCYFDHKMILRQPLRQVIRPSDELLVCSDALVLSGEPAETLTDTKRLYNAVICSNKQDFRMWRVLNHVVSSIYRRHSTGSDLSLTGPLAFYRAIAQNITELELRLKHGFRLKSATEAGRKYEDFYVKEKLTDSIFLTKFYKGFTQEHSSRYGTLWRSQIIYYDTLGRYGAWKVYSYPGQTKCFRAKFERDGKLTLHFLEKIARHVDENSILQTTAVCQNLKLFVVNDETSDTYKVEVPFDQSNFAKLYTIPFSFNP